MKIHLSLLVLIGTILPILADPLTPPVLKRYEEMLLKTPEPGTSFDKVYQHYLEGEGLDALAAQWAAAAEKNDTNRSDYLLLLGLLEDRRGKTDEALKNLRAAAEGGQSWRALSALAAAEASAGKLEDAVSDYKKTLALNPPRDVLVKIYRGLALCQQRLMDYAGAVETWQNYAKASPGDMFVLEEAGDALLDADRYDDARAMFVQIREQKDADPARRLNASLKLAEVERQRGDKEAALKIYTEALAEAGSTGWLQRDVRDRIERLFRSDDDLPGLTKFYEERLKTDPEDLETALHLSDTLAELRRTDDALKVLQSTAKKAPENKDVQLKLASAFLQAERPAEAESVLENLQKAFPNDPAITTQLGEAQWLSFKLGKGSKEKAIATWQKLAPNGADAAATQQLAEIFRAQELTEEALTEYRRALASDPTANDRREHLAEYLMSLDRATDAMKELEGFVTDGRASGENYLRLAKIQRRFKDDAAAQKSLEAAASFPDRAFERNLLAWELISEKKDWAGAEKLALLLRDTAQTEPEMERADSCLIQSFREQNKTDAEIISLIEKQKNSPADFTERDWRLLFQMATENSDNGSLQFALIEGVKQFPKSPMLWKLEYTQARRAGDLNRRLAALENLEQLEPKRAGDWLAERVRAQRENENWDEAVKLAQQYVQLSPAKAEAHLLLADILQAAQKQDEAIVVLNNAVRLSDSPNMVRLRLADIYASTGDRTRSREMIEAAFEADDSPQGKLQLTGRLASAYLQEGKIDDLITKLRERQKAEKGGWRYAFYLAEVYLTMQDHVHALEEMDKALAGKPDDPMLLKRLMSLAETTGDFESILRYSRTLATVEPSKQNIAQLGAALANASKIDEALALLKENSADFLQDPAAWQDVVRQLQANEKTGELAAMLEGQLRANPDDWQTRIAMAEILMGTPKKDKAEDMLWRVLEIKETASAQPQTSPTPPANPSPGFGGRSIYNQRGMAGSMNSAQRRQALFGTTYQQAIQLLSDSEDSNRGYPRHHMNRYPNMGYQPPQQSSGTPLIEAQDIAIIYLACLAVQLGTEKEYLEKLSKVLSDRTPDERLSIYFMLQCPEACLKEIESFVESGNTDSNIRASAFQSLQVMKANRRDAEEGNLAGVSDEKLKSLIEKIGSDMLAAIPAGDNVARYGMLMSLERQEEAEKLADQIIAQADTLELGELQMAFQLAIMRKNFDRAIAIDERLKAQQKAKNIMPSPFQNYSLAMALLTSEKHREKAIDLIAQEFLVPPPNVPAFFFGGPRGGGMGARKFSFQDLRGENASQLLPLPTKALNAQQSAILRNLTNQNGGFIVMRGAMPNSGPNKENEILPLMVKQFNAIGDSKNSPTLKQAAIWLLWFSGKKVEAEAAMKSLIEKQSDDDLLINYCLMLMQSQKWPEALRAIGNIKAQSGDAYDIAIRLRLAIAFSTNNKEELKQAALKLASMPLVYPEQQQLAEVTQNLGLGEITAKLKKAPSAPRNTAQRSRNLIEVMGERLEAGNREEALAIALAILSADPLSRSVRNEGNQQDRALRALKQIGELEKYIEQIKAKLQEAPDSARLNAQLAIAFQVKDPKLAEPYYRKLSELRPNDGEWLMRLGNLLVQSNQSEEAMRLYDQILAQRPNLLFSRGTDFSQPYRSTNSWQRLADSLAKCPDPDSNRLNPSRPNYSNILKELGSQMQKAKPPVDPLEIWLKALKWDGNNSLDLRQDVAQELMRAGRKEEAQKVIEEAFFPPGNDETSAKLFAYSDNSAPTKYGIRYQFPKMAGWAIRR